MKESLSEESTDEDVSMRVGRDSSSDVDDDTVLLRMSRKTFMGCSTSLIGCCGKNCLKWWFHKQCLSDDIVEMTDKELEKLNYFCKFCEKNRMKCQKPKRIPKCVFLWKSLKMS